MDVNGCKLIWMFVPGHRVIWCLIWFIWHSRSNNPFNPFVHSNMSTTIVQLVEAPRRTPCRHCFSCRASTSPRSCDALVWSLVRCRVHVRYHEISTYPGIYHIYIYILFPTCQVRVVRFYQSCSPHPPPPRPPPSPPPPSSSSSFLLLLLRVLLLFYHLCLHFHVHCCLANSWPSSSQTSELSAHCWTSKAR